MDVKLGLAIYNKPWLIEPHAAANLLDYWLKVSAGEEQWSYAKATGEEEEENAATRRIQFAQLFEQNNVIMAPTRKWELKDFAGFGGASVAVIPVNGPLMKADYCGDLGTQSLKSLTRMARTTPGVETIIFLIDSPGGTVDGNKAFADEIAACEQQTIAICDGLMCSAAYWIGSACDKVYTASATDIIGSIGTMCSMVDSSKAMESKGYVLREYYATASKDKNKMFNDALEGDGKALIEEHLDPTNDVFLNAVKASRPNVSPEALTGKTYLAQQAESLGLIDGVKTLEQVMNELNNPTTNSNNYNHNNIVVMTIEKLKAESPDVYRAAFEAGVKEERDRVGSWMAYSDIDLEAVKKGIEEGGDVTRKQMQDFFVKQTAQSTKGAIKNDNAPDVQTAQPEAQPDMKQAKTQSFLESCAAELGVNLPKAK